MEGQEKCRMLEKNVGRKEEWIGRGERKNQSEGTKREGGKKGARVYSRRKGGRKKDGRKKKRGE